MGRVVRDEDRVSPGRLRLESERASAGRRVEHAVADLRRHADNALASIKSPNGPTLETGEAGREAANLHAALEAFRVAHLALMVLDHVEGK